MKKICIKNKLKSKNKTGMEYDLDGTRGKQQDRK